MPHKPTSASKDSVLTQLELPTEILPTLKINPIIAIANDIQNNMFTQVVWHVRPSKVPDNNCVPKNIAKAQPIKALKNDMEVFSVIIISL